MIFRMCKNKDNPYVQINRTVLKDPRLSWKAKGIMSYFLSLPDDWEFYIEEIVTHSSDGECSLRSGIKELIKFGYMERVPLREGRRIKKWITNIYEEPKDVCITGLETCEQAASTTSRFSTSRDSTSRKSRTTKQLNKTKKNINENNIVEGQQQDVIFKKLLEARIKQRLRLLVRHHIIGEDDIERLAREVDCHVTHRPEHLSEQHSLNAAIALIRKGTWSTPKRMSN